MPALLMTMKWSRLQPVLAGDATPPRLFAPQRCREADAKGATGAHQRAWRYRCNDEMRCLIPSRARSRQARCRPHLLARCAAAAVGGNTHQAFHAEDLSSSHRVHDTAAVGHYLPVLAAAAGANCILLFGPTNPNVWAPRNENVQVLRARNGDLGGLDIVDVEVAVTAALCSNKTKNSKPNFSVL